MNPYSGKKAVILARASSTKQVEKGDTIDFQINQCNRYAKNLGIEVVKTFRIIESGRKDEREEFKKVIEYCTNPKNKIDILLFRDISRLTRQGSIFYAYLKNTLLKQGVELKDTFETIQQPINALESYGYKYPWGIVSSSQRSEFYEADRKQDEVNDFLIRSISAEIDYEREGYSTRESEFGYQNIKIEERGKVRSIRAPNPPESDWVRNIFELKAQKILPDDEIVRRVNKLGFRTRKYKKRDSRTREIIGFGGENKLTVRYLNELIRKPIYAGVVYSFWAPEPFLATKFKGLVSIELFNEANAGKVFIERDEVNKINIYTDAKTRSYPSKRSRNNINFPFKNYVLCPYCKKNLKASFSTSKSGKKHGYYHCERGHKRFSVKADVLYCTVYNFVNKLAFKKEFVATLLAVAEEVWGEEKNRLSRELLSTQKELTDLLVNQDNIIKSIEKSTSAGVIKALEDKYEDLEMEIALLRERRTSQEISESDFKDLLSRLSIIMEHPSKFLFGLENGLIDASRMKAFFIKPPTYEELESGTPELTPIFKLSENQNISKNELVTLRGIEPRLPG